ncbi:ABC transporter permease [Paraburkholderia sp. EG285A]|uniref:ABC transporter permease n=1 Tax=Paraburkholderia sp. EG285A TaxID=3237009 RepID=UPI0034D31A7E
MDILQNYVDLIKDYSAQIGLATLVTVELLVVSSFLGFILAIVVAIGRSSSKRSIAYRASTAFSSVFQGTPLLVQLFVIYYGFGQFDWMRDSFLWPAFRNAHFCALLALTLNVAAYMGEHIRAGILSIPDGEKEAAAALGVRQRDIVLKLVIPRALRVATPALTNEIIIQLKSTALASTVTVLDLTGFARRLSAQSYTLDPLIVAGVVYGLMTFSIGLASRTVERYGSRYLQREVRRATTPIKCV